jgi:hypothetical protein
MVTKRYSRPDNIFSTPGLQDLFINCEVDLSSRPTSMDHSPIITRILLPQERIDSPPSFNFRETDWDKYREKLAPRLQLTPDRPLIADAEQLNEVIGNLRQALQETMMEVQLWTTKAHKSVIWAGSECIDEIFFRIKLQISKDVEKSLSKVFPMSN